MTRRVLRFPFVSAGALLLLAACGDDATNALDCVSPDPACTPCPADQVRGDDGLCTTPVPACPGDAPRDGSGECPRCDNGVDANADGRCDRNAVDWSAQASIAPGAHRADIYQLGENREAVVARGVHHTLVWPIDVSGVLLPWRPMATLLENDTQDDSRRAVQNLARRQLGFGTLDEMYRWLGLVRRDAREEVMPGVPWPAEIVEGTPLGVGLVTTPNGDALTFSCATCHTASLFGRTVYGMTNRSAQANEFFHLAAGFFPNLPAGVFESVTGADEDEMALFVRTQQNMGAIGSVLPQVRGLDTSLAQVALSLSRRAPDAWATRDAARERNPDPNALESMVADSKPAVWWNLRYKTRWLSDGSIVSGNPIFTNFLWNELGRGTDLVELEAWLAENRTIIDELTVAAFATPSPRWQDWFGAESLDLDAARRGQVHYNQLCASCHGTYEKAWERPDASSLTYAELLATDALRYHAQTPVLDVGTDLQRAQGMDAFAERLNALAISQWMETVVEVQAGYVPPPLDGIWTRYPYLHNQSVPTLCELLTPAAERVPSFWMGPSDDPETDFDAVCVGFPLGDAVPESWQTDPRAEFDTSGPGLGNFGHDAWLLDGDGQPVLDDAARTDLIAFLKTL